MIVPGFCVQAWACGRTHTHTPSQYNTGLACATPPCSRAHPAAGILQLPYGLRFAPTHRLVEHGVVGARVAGGHGALHEDDLLRAPHLRRGGGGGGRRTTLEKRPAWGVLERSSSEGCTPSQAGIYALPCNTRQAMLSVRWAYAVTHTENPNLNLVLQHTHRQPHLDDGHASDD